MSAIVRAVIVAGTALTLLTTASGLSAATTDPLIGKTYKDASAAVSSWGSTPVIETIIGSRLASDDCIVSTWQKSSFRDIGGTQRKGAILMNLNCNEPVASAGTPGNSAASAEGKVAKHNEKVATWCELPEQATNKNCITFCTIHADMCTVAS
jgi:hypothetical protein